MEATDSRGEILSSAMLGTSPYKKKKKKAGVGKDKNFIWILLKKRGYFKID